MNRTMVKRGIGAAVLAIITALFLGYLLKGKGQERQDVVNMTLPGAQDVKQSLNIPALKGNNTNNLVQKTNSTAGESVIASADGAADKVNQATKDIKTKEIAVNTFKNKGDDLDFTLRPPKGEKREIVDNIGKSESQQRIPKATTDDSNGGIAASANSNAGASSRSSGSITRSSSQGTVVASSDSRSTYRPRLEGERKRSPNYIVAENTARQNRQRQERVERRKERAERHKEQTERRKKREEDDKKKASENSSTSSAKKGHYAIQLLATSSASRAKNLKNVMKKEGYSTFISKTTATGKVLFRVRIGNYSSQKKAKSAQRSMQRRYRKNEQVTNSIIVSR